VSTPHTAVTTKVDKWQRLRLDQLGQLIEELNTYGSDGDLSHPAYQQTLADAVQLATACGGCLKIMAGNHSYEAPGT
jgi:hypothetical protein